ncbi:histidinol-phosphate transaminase [Candidatus Bipolaricaulota bacterium]
MSERPCPQRGLERVSPYVPGKPIDEVKREYGIEDVVKLASNENPLGVSPKAVTAMKEAVERVNFYPDAASYDLRTAIARHFGFSLDQVAIGNGADDLILQLSMACLDEGDEVIASRSSFPVYDVYTHVMRAEMIKTPLAPGYRIDLDAMADRINERTKLVYVCNPNNPTGTIVRADEIDRFLKRVPECVVVVFDEAYFEMVDAEDFPDTTDLVREGRPNVIVLRTFSKAYGLAGIRLGYGFAHPDLVSTLMRIKMVFNVNVAAQAAGIAALDDVEFLKRSVEANRIGRRFFYEAFDRLNLEYAESHTNFVLVRIGPRAEEIQQELLQTGVIVRPCCGYDLPEFLRISIGTPEQNERLIRELERLLEAE